MLDKLKSLYEEFLIFNLDYQKKIGKLYLRNIVLVTGVTCIWKNFFIKKNRLPTLYSYKTGEDIELRNKQIYSSPDKFYKEFIKGEYFDIYSINNKFYSYKLEDYFILSEEYKKVYIDVSIESLYKWLTYDVWKIILLDYDDKQLEFNIQKRIQERWYDKNRIQKIMKIIDNEKKMLEEIKRINKNIIFLKEIKDFNNLNILDNF